MKKNFMLIGLLALALFFVAPMKAEAAEGGTWKNNANGWWYEFADGTYLADGFAEIGGVTYYFDAAGWMKTGWVYVEAEVEEGMEPYGDWYYFNNSGAMVKGWVKSGTDWYYMDSEYGYMVTDGFVDDVYYVGSDGKMVTNDYINWGDGIVAFGPNGRVIEKGWFQIVDSYIMNWVYFEDAGVLANGWIADGGNWYYLDNGLMAMGTYIIEYEGVNHLYKFATDGRMVLDKVATPGWIEADGCWYYYDGEALYKDAWCLINDQWYYFNSMGIMCCNTTKWDEGICYLIGSDGTLASNEWVQLEEGPYTAWTYAHEDGTAYEDEWLKLGNTWYYFDDITMVDTPCYIDGKLELFAKSGAWLTTSNVTNGWVDAPWDSWYYLENGELVVGWKQINGVWYYFDEYDYTAYVGEYYYIDDEEYLFDANGALASGWVHTSWGDWLYGDAEGHPYCDEWLQLGSSWYYFDGHYMVSDTTWTIDGVEHLFGQSGLWLGEANSFADGWHYLDGKWYYVEDGYFVEGLKKIDGKLYGFMEGMIADSIGMVYAFSSENRLGAPIYLVGFDANGNMLKNQWLHLEESGIEMWIWFDAQGYGLYPSKYLATY